MFFSNNIYCFKYTTLDRFGLRLFLHSSPRGEDYYLILEIVAENYCYSYSKGLCSSSCLRPFPKNHPATELGRIPFGLQILREHCKLYTWLAAKYS